MLRRDTLTLRQAVTLLVFILCVNLLVSCSRAQKKEEPQAEYQIREMICYRDGQKIYGKLYLPETQEPLPAVILCHGFGGNLTHMESYAEYFAQNGIAAYAFDFIGGGARGNLSDGKTTEMSVLTEAEDLDIVIDEIQKREDIDKDNLYLMRASQGGYVITYTAAQRVREIKGLIALFPAYLLGETAPSNPETIPETSTLLGTEIGRIYYEDAASVDIYDVMKNYTRDVLIMHGTQDRLVPISYSERVVRVLPSAELVTFEGAGHGFQDKDWQRSAELSLDYILQHLETVYTEPDNENEKFRYVHDPRKNPEAMKDILEDPDAVYGFSPDPASRRLGVYAEYDWSDEVFVAQAKAERKAYHEQTESMDLMLYKMRDEGASTEEMARAISAERNRIRLAVYENDPEGMAKLKKSNLDTYGHEEGPTADQLYEQYGSWAIVIQKAFSMNMGMDAICGLYDEYYPLYIELGYVDPAEGE